jgi:hypothetical protein
MSKKTNFFQKQVGIRPTLFNFLEDHVLKYAALSVNIETGEFNVNAMKTALSNLNIFRSLIDWKDVKTEYSTCDKWLDKKILSGVTKPELSWIVTEKISLYMRIAREGSPDLLIDDAEEAGGYIDEKGVFHDKFPSR